MASHPIERIYDNSGRLREMMLNEEGGYFRKVRRLISEMEFEFMETEPDRARVSALAEEIKTLCTSIQELQK